MAAMGNQMLGIGDGGGNNNYSGHYQGQGQPRRPPIDKSKVKCNYTACGEFGHYMSECPMKKRDDERAATERVRRILQEEGMILKQEQQPTMQQMAAAATPSAP